MENYQQNQTQSISGFDVQAGQSWIYPTNYPLRDYQFNIVQQALYKNTLVSLPTGLGKTFIAAVVMYNFYRWYPTGKIVFMAPTRPLVKQQMDACYDITAIPRDVTAELTGSKQISTRKEVWMEHRMLFITPQILQNDLDYIEDLGESIKCLVFDEAHRAKGNYAYCEVIRKLQKYANGFRVLALSATPGNTLKDVGDVIRNLLISHCEFKTEESVDVKPYVFERKLETVIVPLGEKLEQIKDDYAQLLEKYVRKLKENQVIYGNYSTLSKGAIFKACEAFKQNNKRHPIHNELMKTFTACISLYHANDVLIKHGLRIFLSYWEGHINEPMFRTMMPLVRIVEDVRDYLREPLPIVSQLPDGSYTDIPKNVKFGHPKFYKLRDILLAHFTSTENSRAIVFIEYRDSVKEAFLALLQAQPIILAKEFVGQKGGVTQRTQLNVIKAFREGSCNTLLATSIGEEGLDVGEVDLIICFDISTKSPIRMIQRMGRTGRKREGRIVALVTEGQEHETYLSSLYYKNNMRNWGGSVDYLKEFFVESSRMVPENIVPECMKMQMTIRKPLITEKRTLKDMIKSLSKEESSSISEDIEIIEIIERIPECLTLFDKPLPQIITNDYKPAYNKYIEKQHSSQGNVKIKPSHDSKMLVELLKYADSKRFNIPLTQDEIRNKNLKQGDIRSMFTKVNSKDIITVSQNEFITQKSANTQVDKSSNIDDSYKELHIEIANYLSIQLTLNKNCEICNKLFECDVQTVPCDNIFEDIKHWERPDFSDITLNDLELFEKTLDENDEKSQKDPILHFIGEFDEENKMCDKSLKFEAPKSFRDIIEKFDDSMEKKVDEQDLDELLKFFLLEKLEDIFENNSDSDATIIYQVESEKLDEFDDFSLSPVLGTQRSQRSKQKIEESDSPILKTGAKVNESSSEYFDVDKSIVENNCELERNISESSEDENLLGVFGRRKKTENSQNTESVNIGDFCDLSSFGLGENSKEKTKIEVSQRNIPTPKQNSQKENRILEMNDICDVSTFGLNDDTFAEDFGNFSGKKASTQMTKTVENDAKIVPDSPEKIIDLTESPEFQKTQKSKVMTQMSITQIMNLVPTQKKCSNESQLKPSNSSNILKPTPQEIVKNVFKTPILKKISPKKKTNHTKLMPRGSSNIDSDDDFQDLNISIGKNVSKPSNINRTNLNKSLSIMDIDSDDEFEVPIKKTPPKNSKKQVLKPEVKKSKSKKQCDFIDYEAEVSDKNDISSDENCNDGSFDQSFVNDETQCFQNDTQTHAKYLQSIRSPRTAKFKIPAAIRPITHDIFSQPQNNQEENSYMNDSFCVSSQEVDKKSHDLSELEILEKKLKKMKKKRKHSQDNFGGKKRKRIFQIGSDSD